MSDRLLLDTHVWLWMSINAEKISSEQTARLRSAANLYISAVTLYEVANLVRKNRIDLTMPLTAWFDLNLAQPGVTVMPLTPQIATAAADLPAAFHGDPIDRMISATAVAHNMTLCTHDSEILRFGKQGTFQYLEI